VEQNQGDGGETPDKIEKLPGPGQSEAEKNRPINAHDAVGPSGQAEDVVDQSDAHDFHDADGHH
jgi:hypothetical protein